MIAPAYVPPPQYSYVIQRVTTAPYSIVDSISSSASIEDSLLLSRFIRYQNLKDSFLTNVGNGVNHRVKSVFEEIAQEIGSVAFNKAKVEYSPLLDMIQFSLSFANGMRLSFGKPIDEPEEKDVVFSLSMNNEVLVVDKKTIVDLKDVLVETVNQ